MRIHKAVVPIAGLGTRLFPASHACKKEFFPVVGPDGIARPLVHYQIMDLIGDRLGKKLAGIIPNENGAGSGVNGWIQAAALNLPMVDAPANGRAHPTGLMGAMGLHRQKDYHSVK